MEWTDEGLILGVRRHGETSVILEAMTETHGRHLGLVRGGRSARMRPVLQPGNSVGLTWRARLSEHLGHYGVEPARLRVATLMQSAVGLYGLQVVAAHLRLLPERDPHGPLYRAALVMLDHLDEPQKAARLLIRFELALLDELGFGLDLSRCTATGQRDDLAFVSPKTGRAVSRDAGAPWAGRLLPLPSFLAGASVATGPRDLAQGLDLTRHFLDKDVWTPRGINPPDERSRLVAAALASIDNGNSI
jgi:DNA repair protein RecO (recombination protein O)